MNGNTVLICWYGLFVHVLGANLSHSHNCSSCIPLVWAVFVLLVVDGRQLNAGYVHRVTTKDITVIVQEFYAQKGPFTKQIATEGFSTVFGQLMSPL